MAPRLPSTDTPNSLRAFTLAAGRLFPCSDLREVLPGVEALLAEGGIFAERGDDSAAFSGVHRAALLLGPESDARIEAGFWASRIRAALAIGFAQGAGFRADE